MKIVLRSCYKQKYENPTESDECLVYRCLVAVIQPILRPIDLPIFNGFINDLFPAIGCMQTNYVVLRQAFDELCSSQKLQPIERLYGKLIETHETLATRHALMLIGAPYTGKSTILRILAKAMSASNENPENGIEIGA